MEFKVDASLQKQLMQECRKIYKGTGFLWLWEKAMILLAVGGLIWFSIWAVATDFIHVNRNGEQVFDSVVFVVAFMIGFPGLFFGFCIRLFRIRVEFQHCSCGRMDERLKIMDDKLFYTSRFTEEMEDVVHLLIMDLRTTTKIIYDEKRRIMFLQGKMLERAVTTDKEDVVCDENKMVQTMFKLVDCFTPSLHEYLKSYLPEEVVEYHQELPTEKLKELERKVLLGE